MKPSDWRKRPLPASSFPGPLRDPRPARRPAPDADGRMDRASAQVYTHLSDCSLCPDMYTLESCILSYRPGDFIPSHTRNCSSAENPTIAYTAPPRAQGVRGADRTKDQPASAGARSARRGASLQQARLTSPFLSPRAKKPANNANITTALNLPLYPAAHSPMPIQPVRRANMACHALLCFFLRGRKKRTPAKRQSRHPPPRQPAPGTNFCSQGRKTMI